MIDTKMKKLVIYYSFEGNTKLLAEAISKEINGDILELKPEKDIKSQKSMKYFWGGKQVFFRERPKLEKYHTNPEEYDVIFIGTPVWSFSYTPAIRSFLDEQQLKDKNIALFCTHEGSKGKVFDKMKEKLKGNKIVGEKDFINVLKNKEKTVDEAKKWAREI